VLLQTVHAMIIRPAALTDAASLARIQVDSYRSAYRGILPEDYLARFSYEEQTQDWRALLTDEPAAVLFVAEEAAGAVVGYALGALLEQETYDCELAALHVRRPAQGRGAGHALIRAVARHFEQLGRRSLVIWVLEANQPARSLYERWGGQLVGQRQVDLGEGLFFSEVAYAWSKIELLSQAAPTLDLV